MDALKAVWHQFAKDFDKLPGWVPLFVLTLLALEWVALPDHVSAWGRTVPLSREFAAAALTLLLYTVGDALDESVFKSGPKGARNTRARFKNKYSKESDIASGAMGVGSGLYSAALGLAGAGEKQRGKLAIHIPNEAAKFLRAMIMPLVVIGIVLSFQGRLYLALLCWVGAVAVLYVYPLLKVRHIRQLYSAAASLVGDPKHRDAELGGMRLVFWDGNLVGSGISQAKNSEGQRAPGAPSSV